MARDSAPPPQAARMVDAASGLGVEPASSPARDLQSSLRSSFQPEASDTRWPRPLVALATLGYCSAVWVAIALGVSGFF